jgi:HPr kinase/phosphorylase
VTERETTSILTVGDLLAEGLLEPPLRLLAGSGGLRRTITDPAVRRPGLALAGRPESLPPGTLQILGLSESAWLAERDPAARQAVLERLSRSGVACLVLSHGQDPTPDLVRACESHALPLLGHRLPSAALMERLRRCLEERLAPSITVHGTLIDIYGVGVLILGESGVGKSESALELVLRGHRLVSDDVVILRRLGGSLNGAGPEVSRFHMELRGIGIINIKDLYGVTAVRERKDVDLVIQLDPWQEGKDYERLGLEDRAWSLLAVTLPFIEMPVRPGRNLSILLEVAARNHLLRSRGYHPARELAGRIQQAMGRRP